MDALGLYSNIPHYEGLSAPRKRLEERGDKDVSTDNLVELAEGVLKNKIFNSNEKTLKQKRGTTIVTKFIPSYSILSMAELEEKILKAVDHKSYLWWRYTDDIFFIWEHGEEKLKSFVKTLYEIQSTMQYIYCRTVTKFCKI